MAKFILTNVRDGTSVNLFLNVLSIKDLDFNKDEFKTNFCDVRHTTARQQFTENLQEN